jgi:hypothetical protein
MTKARSIAPSNPRLTRAGLYSVTRPARARPSASDQRARPNGKFAKLSEDVKGFLDEANDTSEPARTAWLAFLSLLTYVIVTLASRQPQGSAPQQPGQAADHQCGHPARRLLSIRAGDAVAGLPVALVQHVIVARKYRRFTDAIIRMSWKPEASTLPASECIPTRSRRSWRPRDPIASPS